MQAKAGATLDILHNDIKWQVRVARVVKNGGLGGEEPLLARATCALPASKPPRGPD